MIRLKKTNRKYSISARAILGGDIVISYGYMLSQRDVENFIVSHKRWIATHSQMMKENAEYLERYKVRDLVLLHGNDYRVRYIEGEGTSIFDGSIVTIYHNGEKGKAFDKWFLNYAKKYLKDMFSLYAKDVCKMNVKSVKGYYGICYRRNKDSYINLNSALVHADDECIRYVIHHEITHLDVPNHSAEFYAQLEMLEPNYKAIRDRLRKVVCIADE